MRLAIDEHMQHKDVYTHSLVVLEQAIDRETGRPGPRAAPRRAAARHRQARDPAPGAGRAGELPPPRGRSGRSSSRKRLRALRYPKAVVDEVAQLVFLHLRFHGYGSGEWTDSAVRRYVTDAGPLLDRLHKLVRSDCTTRNRGGPRRCSAATTRWSGASPRCAPRRSSTRSGPTSTATRSCGLLGIPPGPAGRQGVQAPARPADGTRAAGSGGGGGGAAAVGGGERGRAESARPMQQGGVRCVECTRRRVRCIRGTRRSTRSWASRPSRYTPLVAATSHGAPPSGGASNAATATAST